MKRKMTLLSLVLCLCLAFAAGCTVQQQSTKYVYSLNERAVTLTVGDTKQLTVTASPEKKDLAVVYQSDNTAVASVSEDGLITALAEGSALITATVDGNTLECNVTVQKPEIKYEYALSKTALTLESGATASLSVTVEPQKDISVAWESENAEIATVDQSGLVTAVAAGETKINATVDGKVLSCTVTVSPKIEYEYALNKTELNLMFGDNETLAVTVTPEKNITVEYVSANPEIVTVDGEGKVTAIGVGKTTVTAKVDGKELACAITVIGKPALVTEMEIYTGKTQSVDLKFNPESYAPENIKYESANTEIATVDNSGLVAGVKAGDTTITVTVDGKAYEVKVTVKQSYEYALDKTSLRLGSGKTDKLTVVITPDKTIEEGNLTFTSANPEIATVEPGSGVVTGVKAGKTTITATVDGKELTCEVEVYNIYTYAISATTKDMFVGNSVTLEVTSIPESEVVATWTTSDEAVATVEKGVVTAKKAGKATITATIKGGAEDGSDVILTCEISVTAQITATSTVTYSAENPVYNLTAQEGYQVLDWTYHTGEERFDDRKNLAADKQYITADNKRNSFWDYKSFMAYTDGVNKAGYSRAGSCGANGKEVHEITVKLTTDLNEIRVFTGAYKATNVTELYFGDQLLSSQTFVGGDDSNCAMVAFKIDSSALNPDGTQSVKIVIKATEVGGGGNASLVAVQALKTDANVKFETAKATVVKNAVVDGQTVDLTKIGGIDWWAYNAGQKKGGTVIPENTLDFGRVDGNGGDYKGKLTYSDADGDNASGETRNFKYSDEFAQVTLPVKTGEIVHLFVTGWNATYAAIITDEKGVIVYRETVCATGGNTSAAYQLDVTLDKAGTYNFAVYTESGSNCGIAAVAIEEVKIIEDKLTATASILSSNDNPDYNMSAVPGYDVLDWTYYGPEGNGSQDARKKLDSAKQLITADVKRQAFWDYKTVIHYYDGENGGGHTIFGNCGANGDAAHTIRIKLTEDMTEIRVLTGAYKAKNTTALIYNNEVVASQTLTADGDSNCSMVTFKFDASKLDYNLEQYVQVKISAENQDGGNASLVAVQALKANAATVYNNKATVKATEVADGQAINITEIGKVDWMLFEGDATRQKKDGNAIDATYLASGRDAGVAHDYRGHISYSDAEGDKTSGTARSFRHSANFVEVKATVAAGQKMIIFLNGWDCGKGYGLAVYDEQGQLVVAQKIGGVGGANQAFSVEVAPSNAGAYRLAIYKIGGNNCGIAALAVA